MSVKELFALQDKAKEYRFEWFFIDFMMVQKLKMSIEESYLKWVKGIVKEQIENEREYMHASFEMLTNLTFAYECFKELEEIS